MKTNHSVLKHLNVSLLTLAATLLITNTATAESTVVGKLGTLGGGLEYVHSISPKFAIGIGYNGFSYDDDLDEGGINYDADLQMENISIIGDYHPFANGFRISAGVTSNGNEFALSAKPTEGGDPINVGGVDYDANSALESLDGLISFKSTAPYLGIGWGHAPKSGKGWSFDTDLGVLFQGSPITSLSATCTDGNECPDELKTAVAEEENDLQSDSEEFDVYPVLTIGVSYTF